MTAKNDPKPPDRLQAAGWEFWKQVLASYDLRDPHHLELLAAAATCLDRAKEAREALDKDGLTIVNRFDELREHPACNIERQSLNQFRQMVRELGLDLEDAPAAPRGPRRPGTRN